MGKRWYINFEEEERKKSDLKSDVDMYYQYVGVITSSIFTSRRCQSSPYCTHLDEIGLDFCMVSRIVAGFLQC